MATLWNLNLGIRDQGWILDFKRFRVYLEQKYNVKEAFLFIGYVESNKNLYKFLKKSGYSLIFKPTIKDINGRFKGNVDSELVLYSCRIEYDNYDTAIIVSGDGDFYCLVKYLHKENKLSKILIPNKNIYSSLLDKISSNKLAFMNNLKKKLDYKK